MNLGRGQHSHALSLSFSNTDALTHTLTLKNVHISCDQIFVVLEYFRCQTSLMTRGPCSILPNLKLVLK